MLQSGYIAFAIIEVRGDNAEDISARMGKVTEIALEHGALIDAQVSGLVIISRGMLPPGEGVAEAKPFSLLLLEMLAGLKDNVRITHGGEVASFGKLGTSTRFSYSFIAPSFGKALSELISADYGKIIEVT